MPRNRLILILNNRLLLRGALVAALFAATLSAVRAEAIIVGAGDIHVTGTFTLNPAYNFNQPSAQPFGSFANTTVSQANGLFAPYVASGDALVMNTPFVLTQPSTSNPMLWSVGGYTFNTTRVSITGADFGRFVLGFADLSGNGFNPADYGLGASSLWSFTAPPYDIGNFTQPITGPLMNMEISVVYDDGRVPVPEGRSTITLLVLGLIGVEALRRKLGLKRLDWI